MLHLFFKQVLTMYRTSVAPMYRVRLANFIIHTSDLANYYYSLHLTLIDLTPIRRVKLR